MYHECPTPDDIEVQVSAIVSEVKQWQDVGSCDCPGQKHLLTYWSTNIVKQAFHSGYLRMMTELLLMCWRRPWLKLILIFMLETSNLLNTGQLIIIMAAMKKQNAVMNLLAQCNSMQALMDPTVMTDSLKMPLFAVKKLPLVTSTDGKSSSLLFKPCLLSCNVGKYCIFLKKMVASKNWVMILFSSIVKFLTDK